MTKELRKKNRCNRRLQRVVGKCPQLLNTDTVRDTLRLEIPSIEIDTFFNVEQDTDGIDSIFNLYKLNFLDSIGGSDLKNTVIRYIENNTYSKDTIVHHINGITFTFFFTKGQLNYRVDRPKEEIEKIVEIPVDIIKPIELTFLEHIQNLLSRFWKWILIVFGIFILYKLFRKYII